MSIGSWTCTKGTCHKARFSTGPLTGTGVRFLWCPVRDLLCPFPGLSRWRWTPIARPDQTSGARGCALGVCQSSV